MNEFLRDRIVRKLDGLSDERMYQVLDYVEFLESKYAERQVPPPNVFSKFAEGVEDTLRAGRVSASTISETMGLLGKAMGVLNGVAAAGKSVASDLVDAASRVSAAGTPGVPPTAAPAPGTDGPSSTPAPQSPPTSGDKPS